MAGSSTSTVTMPQANVELRVDVISDPRTFREMGSSWNALVDQAGLDHPFMYHEWLLTWWECFGQGLDLYIIAVRSGKDLIALAPLIVRHRKMFGVMTRRIEAIYNDHTPRFDFIVARHHALVYRTIWAHLLQQKDRWDVVLLFQIPEGSGTFDEMAALAQADGYSTGVWSPSASPYIELGMGFQDFMKNLKGHHRRNIRSRFERLSTLSSVTMEMVTSRADLPEALRDAIRIEAAGWKGRQGTAIESDPAVAEFYKRLAERAANRGWLRLIFLKLGDRRIAMDYALSWNHKLYGVKIGYDPEFHTYSPGNLLLYLILQHACTAGHTEYEFLGADDAWKQDWSRVRRRHHWLYIFQKNARAQFVFSLKFGLIPAIKTKFRRGSLV